MRIREYLDTSAKIDKTKSTLLSQTFKVGESYLAEQFRQITHYLAEHLIQKNNILFNEQLLTL